HTDTHRHTVPDALMRLEAVIHERKRGTFFFLVLLLLFPLLPFYFSLSIFLSLSLPPSLCFSLFPLLPFSFSFSLSLSVSLSFPYYPSPSLFLLLSLSLSLSLCLFLSLL